jgi:hypothetical protein
MDFKVLKKELKRIFEWLLTQLTEEDKSWLSEHRNVIWGNFKEIRPDSWWDMYADFKHEISFRIRDILDAKQKKEKISYGPWGRGLSRYCLVKTAELLNIECLSNKNKIKLLNEILSKIP